MRTLTTFCLALFLLGAPSCNDVKEELAETLLVQLMTDGQWRVSSFKKGTADHTTDFASYTFQFRSNRTVEALKTGTVEKIGTWREDASARTITSNFDGSAAPLQWFNGSYRITDSGLTYVIAERIVGAETWYLRLDK